MKNIDSASHVRGESIYVDDIPVMEDTLYAAVFGSPVAHGNLKGVDYSEALKCPGVEGIITAKDITGENQIGSIIQDEELFADHKVDFIGMPIAVVLAKTDDQARRALKKIKVDIEELPPIVTARDAFAAKQFICPTRTFNIGDLDNAWKDCIHIIEGQAEMGGQEHVYLETQAAYAYPAEHGGVKIHSSTQAPSYVQRGVAKVLAYRCTRSKWTPTASAVGLAARKIRRQPGAAWQRWAPSNTKSR